MERGREGGGRGDYACVGTFNRGESVRPRSLDSL